MLKISELQCHRGSVKGNALIKYKREIYLNLVIEDKPTEIICSIERSNLICQMYNMWVWILHFYNWTINFRDEYEVKKVSMTVCNFSSATRSLYGFRIFLIFKSYYSCQSKCLAIILRLLFKINHFNLVVLSSKSAGNLTKEK